MISPRPSPLRARRLRVAAALAALAGAVARGQSSGSAANSDPMPKTWDRPGVSDEPGYLSRTAPRAIDFPPIPPPLYLEWRRDPRAFTTSQLDPVLAGALNEIFYPQLATRLADDQLKPGQRREVLAYLAEKAALQTQLRAELARVAAFEPAARAAALRTLAQAQAPRLAWLATRAEELREKLLIADGNWSEFRQWHLADGSRRADNPGEIASVFQATAYFQDCLSLAQRDLLRIVALEIYRSVQPELADTAAADQLYLQFLPAPARIAVPPHVPDDLAKTLAAFESRLARLKKELYDAVVAQDNRMAWLRRGTLASLAEKQAPEFAALEELAEQIRRGLDALPARDRMPGASPLPAEIAARVAKLVRDRRALGERATKQIAALNAPLEGRMLVNFNFDGGKLLTWIEDRRAPRDRPGEKIAELAGRLDAEVAAIADDYAQSYAALATEGAALQRDIAQLPQFSAPGAAAIALAKAARLELFRQQGDAYEDYRIATLVPGLAPAQRRLMFDAALARLDLPVPHGQMQPVRRVR